MRVAPIIFNYPPVNIGKKSKKLTHIRGWVGNNSEVNIDEFNVTLAWVLGALEC